jgi:hypothetical protein
MSKRSPLPYRPSRRQVWLRVFVWVFLVIFAFSVVGGVVVFTANR